MAYKNQTSLEDIALEQGIINEEKYHRIVTCKKQGCEIQELLKLIGRLNDEQIRRLEEEQEERTCLYEETITDEDIVEIGHYCYNKKQAPLGLGGTGEVYLGRAPDGNEVAIKKYIGNPENENRFQREAEILKKLNHPNIIKIFDILKNNKDWFIVMEFAKSSLRDLHQNIQRERPFSTNEIYDVVSEITNGLHYLSQNNIIHRDIKPANILFINGKVKIADFGFAKEENATQITLALASREFGLGALGTPLYMSPEQINDQKVSYKTDLYSLGVIIYEMVYAKNPFTGRTPLDTMRKHATEKPDLNNCPLPEWESIIESLLKKIPDERPKIEELLNELLKINKKFCNQENNSETYIPKLEKKSETEKKRLEVIPTRNPVMNAKLQIEHNNHCDTIFLYSKNNLIFGREYDGVQDIILPYKEISRNHLGIILKNKDVIAMDLNSSNGTYIQPKDTDNQLEKLSVFFPKLLQNEDKIILGRQEQVTLQFSLIVAQQNYVEVNSSILYSEESIVCLDLHNSPHYKCVILPTNSFVSFSTGNDGLININNSLQGLVIVNYYGILCYIDKTCLRPLEGQNQTALFVNEIKFTYSRIVPEKDFY